MAQEPLDDPWAGVNLKLEHASFHLEGMGRHCNRPNELATASPSNPQGRL